MLRETCGRPLSPCDGPGLSAVKGLRHSVKRDLCKDRKSL